MASTATSRSMSTTTASRSSRSATPTSLATMPSAKPTVPPRSSTPTARSSARSSTPTSRASVTGSKSTSRAATPTRRATSVSSTTNTTVPPVKSVYSPSGTRSATTASRNPAASHASSPTVKPRPWKPSDIPGFSLDAPPNLKTSLPDRPIQLQGADLEQLVSGLHLLSQLQMEGLDDSHALHLEHVLLMVLCIAVEALFLYHP
ncbi:hypothetical protein MTR67_013244 [Solanum verrucosum]|uniref:Uncharacterized protein n=1 Tax=Solanum verrucosum TaxID=315347 RepID=A0AAF0QA45_SOLVR|nr:hypothetical protein MTR67_013244 [Solanum verrucosum]